MKAQNLIIFLLPILFFSYSAVSQEENNSEVKIKETKVEVYYFHNTRRCATCNAVEDVTKATLEESYSEQYKEGELTFTSLNLEEEEGEKVARKLKVSGQTLLIIVDGKKKDLTNDAFMYARSKPDKLKAKIIKTIGTI